MSINVANELKKARAGKYAIGAFNTSNLEVTKAICHAAAKFDQPILIQTTPSAIEYAGLKQIFDIVSNEIKANKIKAAIHLDHGKDFDIVKKAIDIGYTSVMFDGSTFPYDENVLMTSRVVNYAHARGVSVEAEIGVIGHEEGGAVSGQSVMSMPDQVKNFIDLTGIDSVAVSVGNQHGAPSGEKVDFRILESIANVVEIPLVMHGSSGLSDGDIRGAIGLGVAKFNIDTNIKVAFSTAIEGSKETDYRKANAEGMEEVEKVVAKYIELLSCGKK
jgi:ketose-bisphosphate aldolase